MDEIHTFDNGVKVYERHLMSEQKERYEKHNVHEEDEEQIFHHVIDGLDPDATYVSVGTAIGYYPILAKKKRASLNIFCLEPLKLHVESLKENMILNDMQTSEFSIFEVAVSTKAGIVRFSEAAYGSKVLNEKGLKFLKKKLFQLLNHRTIKKRTTKIVEVPSIPLSQIFKLIDKGKIDFLQMDIQGHEQVVLEQYFKDIFGRSESIETFLVGTHSKKIHLESKRLFEQNGYNINVDEFETENQPDGILCCSKRIN